MTSLRTLQETPPDPRQIALMRIYRLLLLVVTATAVILTVWIIGDLLTILFAVVLLAVILHGVAELLSRHTRLPYWAALPLVVIVIFVLFAGLILLAGPGLSYQAATLRQLLGVQATALHGQLSQHGWGRLILQQVPTLLGGDKTEGGLGVPSGFAGSVAGFLGSAFGLFGTTAVVLIAALYLAASPATYVDGVLRVVTVAHRPKARELCALAGGALWAWSAGQALDMLVVGILSALGLWVIGVPLALLLGVLAGLSNFVPYIGTITGAVPAVLLAFSIDPTRGLETIALYAVIQGFEGNVMAPMIQKRAVNLPPGLTILSQTAFGAILGIPGFIFATPITAAILAVLARITAPLEASVED